ncbi:hypothetical protein EB796_023858 [Bugula neritina]|uniref:Uncharacterized protein n=1 Tax=Bugula neritina TaxID=10212 RepID=A0A7J7IWM5_BUGNE|nr:hypothetical protein EB796_023858 [Bugula neritina]
MFLCPIAIFYLTEAFPISQPGSVLRLHSLSSRVVAIIQLYVWVNDWGCVDTLYCSLSRGLGTKLLHSYFASLLISCRRK